MPRPRLRAIFPRTAVAALLFAFAALHAETVLTVPTVPESGATIRFGVPWTQTPRFGFAPVRVSIENRANGQRTWHIRFEAGMRNMFPGVLTTEEAISVPAGQTRDVWIFVPLAEPGMNMGPMGGTGYIAPPLPAVVKITPTPTGKKVTATRTNPGGSTNITETEIDSTTGTLTTTYIQPSGASSTQSRTTPLRPGSTVTFTIDPSTGFVSPNIRGNVRSTAPAIVNIVTATGPAALAVGAGSPMSGAVPSTPMMLSAEVSGPGVSGGRTSFPGSTNPNGMRPFAVSATIEPVLRGKLSTLVRGAPNLSLVDPAQLPADWRVWSSFSGVMLTTAEYAGLDAARRAALRAWVALGGQLCLSPAVNNPALENDSMPIEKVGAGTILTLSAESLSEASPAALLGKSDLSGEQAARLARTQAEIQARRAARAKGPGPVSGPRAKAADSDAGVSPVALPPLGLWQDLQLFAGTAGLPDRAALTLENGPLFDAVKEDATENAWLAIFLVGFAAVVGPVNLFLFAPAQKRHRLFVTTPLIALVASLLLGVTILVQDGTGGAGARLAFVVLLPGENTAAVFQEQAARTGFLTRRSFALPADVALAVLPFETPIPFGGPNVDLERGSGRAGGDWFQSRARQAQQLRRIVPTRARVESVDTAPDGTPIVQSSLGTTLRQFAYVDADGRWWEAAELPAGQRVKLQPAVARSGPNSTEIGGTPNLRGIVDTVGVSGPGHWHAFGGATELAPIPTLTSIRWKDTHVLYAGALENAAGVSPTGTARSVGDAP